MVIFTELVQKFYSTEDEILEAATPQQVKALSDDAMATGIESLLKKCTKPILNDLDKDFKESNYTKPMMVHKLMDVLFEKGVSGFFEDFDLAIVANVASKFLGKKFETENVSKEELIEKVEEETYLQGLTKFFEHFSIKDLKDWCKKLKIEVASSSKKRLARAIIFGGDLVPSITRTYSGGSKPSQEDKPEIDKTISKEDLLKYKVVELRKYCKSFGIKKSGNKNELVERITKFHTGEEVEMEAKSKKRSRSKKSDDESYAEGDTENPTKKRKTEKTENGSAEESEEEPKSEENDDDMKEEEAPITEPPVEESKENLQEVTNEGQGNDDVN